MIRWLRKHIFVDAIAFGSLMAVVPLLFDVIWWVRDYELGIWTWHLAIILTGFVVSIVGTTIAAIWYHNTRDHERDKLQQQIDDLKSQMYCVYDLLELDSKASLDLVDIVENNTVNINKLLDRYNDSF